MPSVATVGAEPDPRPLPCDLLVRNGRIYTVDARDSVIDGGAVAIAGGRIVAVGPDRDVVQRYSPARTIEAGGGDVHPGFIDAHVHVSQYTARSVLPRMAGTSVTMGDWKGALTPEDEHASAAVAALDYLRCGYTGFVDPGTIFEPDAVAAVADEVGIRIWLADPYVADLGDRLKERLPELVSPSFLVRWPRDRDAALARLGGQLFRNKVPDGRVRAFIGLYGEGTGSDELRRTAHDLARSAGVQFAEHLGYLPRSYREREVQLGRSMVAHLRDAGQLGPHATYIHMNVVHADDVPILAQQGARIVWCPYGQLQMLGQGGAEPRTIALHRAGVPIGIGSDIPRAFAFDAFGGLAVAAAAAIGQPAKPSEILRMRTIGAAATVGAASETGSIEVGKRADLVLRRPTTSEALGFDGPLEFSVLGGRDSVDSVIVDGAVAIRDGRAVLADERQVIDRAHASARRIAAQIGL